MKKVNKDSPLPLYYQLEEILRELIENEEWKPLDPIPSERELCDIHGVSRMTVNKAILHMVNEGLLFREQGKGTFVSRPKEKHQLSAMLGFTEDMKQRGLAVDTRILSFKREKASKAIANQLALKEKQEVFEITRLRIVEAEPYAYEIAYIPAYLCEGLTRAQLENRSLYELLSSVYNLVIDHATQTIEPVITDEYTSGILQVENNALALKFSRRAYLEDNTPVEFTRSVYRSDRYKFEITSRR